MNTTRAAADHKAIEAIIYANAIRGDVAAFTAAIAAVPTRRLRAAYRAAFDHLPEAWTGNRATTYAGTVLDEGQLAARVRAAISAWSTPAAAPVIMATMRSEADHLRAAHRQALERNPTRPTSQWAR